MKIFILLLFTLAVALLFTLFPEIASHTLRIEAFGWVFETRQGAFITALIILLALLWLLRRIFSAILAGPGQLWNTLRMGSKKRREQRLREGIAEMLDMRGKQGKKAFKKSAGIIPDWAATLLNTLITPASELSPPDADADPLHTALSARMVSDPHATSKPDAAIRKVHLKAWLQAHPDAPLAIYRLATLAEEEGDWRRAVQLLDQAWKQGIVSAASIKPRLAKAYIHLAEDEPEQSRNHLRRAERLVPENGDVVLALGQSQIRAEHADAAKKLWLAYLEKHNDFNIAAALFELLKADALAAFRKLDKRDAAKVYQPAMRWLQASLAHSANLNGLADEIMDQLLEGDAVPEVIRSRAAWYAEAGQWEQATACYQKLCDNSHSKE